jgi:predicted RNA-binding Zn-ribbon protein involved in translation (DUF1610 family)
VSASPDLAQPAPDRLVIRPALWLILTLGVTAGVAGALAGMAGIVALLHGQPAGLIFLALGAFCLALAYVTVSGTLWADRDRVGCTRLIERGSCSRDELASIRIVPSGTKSGPWCVFVRKDGSVALRTAARVWGNDRLAALATFLGVPFVHDSHPASHVCPACGYPWLEEAPYANGVGSREICPCCGFEFSGPADAAAHEAWRQQWIAGGMSWWAGQAGRPAPSYWDAAGQLRALLGS